MKTTRTRIIYVSKIPKTQTKRRFLAKIKHYIINLEFWIPHFVEPSFSQGPQLRVIVILCILPLFTCRPFWILFSRLGPGPTNSCSAFPSSCFRFSLTKKTVLITFKPPRVLFASNRREIARNTRQAKHDSTTTGQAKDVGIERAPSLWQVVLTWLFTGILSLWFVFYYQYFILPSVCILPLVCNLQSAFYPRSAVCVLHWPAPGSSRMSLAQLSTVDSKSCSFFWYKPKFCVYSMADSKIKLF